MATWEVKEGTSGGLSDRDRRTLDRARAIAAKQLTRLRSEPYCSPGAVKEVVADLFIGLSHEVFMVIMCDVRHRPMSVYQLEGTLDGCSVYPREVAKRCLLSDCATVFLAHNHPSGDPSPSAADKAITRRLQEALALFEVKVLDHIIVGHPGEPALSFAEQGLL